jgi:hypothetical protein
MDNVPQEDDYCEPEKNQRNKLQLVLEVLEQKKVGAGANCSHQKHSKQKAPLWWDSFCYRASFGMLSQSLGTPMRMMFFGPAKFPDTAACPVPI